MQPRPIRFFPATPQLLADVCAARFPHAFPILETDYKGAQNSDSETQEECGQHFGETLCSTSKSPKFQDTRGVLEDAAGGAGQICRTDSLDRQVWLCSEDCSSSLENPSFIWGCLWLRSRRRSFNHSFRYPAWTEVGGLQSISRRTCQSCLHWCWEASWWEETSLMEQNASPAIVWSQTTFQCCERTLSVLARMEGWRCPFKLQFLLRPAELNEPTI